MYFNEYLYTPEMGFDLILSLPWNPDSMKGNPNKGNYIERIKSPIEINDSGDKSFLRHLDEYLYKQEMFVLLQLICNEALPWVPASIKGNQQKGNYNEKIKTPIEMNDSDEILNYEI